MDEFKITVADDIDTVLNWIVEGDSKSNKCRVRIYWITWEKAIVIVTNITYYSGRKITDATKEIISFVTNIHSLSPSKLMLVEHYPASNLSEEDLYHQVLLTNNEAIRHEIDRSKLLKLLGKTV